MPHSQSKKTTVVIMAGGMGKRFGIGKVKVLQEVFGKPMLVHLLDTVKLLNPSNIFVIVNSIYEHIIRASLISYMGLERVASITFVRQTIPLGTGHALQCCIPQLVDIGNQNVLILSGDTPMMRLSTMKNIIEQCDNSDVVLTVRNTENPSGYGRVLLKNEAFDRIVEERDADDEQRRISLINCGIYCIRADLLVDNLPSLSNDNVQHEYYLTDVVKLIKDNHGINVALCEIAAENAYEVMGVNTPEDLELLITKRY